MSANLPSEVWGYIKGICETIADEKLRVLYKIQQRMPVLIDCLDVLSEHKSEAKVTYLLNNKSRLRYRIKHVHKYTHMTIYVVRSEKPMFADYYEEFIILCINKGNVSLFGINAVLAHHFTYDLLRSLIDNDKIDSTDQEGLDMILYAMQREIKMCS